MNKQETIQNEIDKTMDSLNKSEPVEKNPFLYTRIQQRLNEKAKKEFSIYSVLKPAFFTALIALNLTTAIWYTNSESMPNSEETNLKLTDVLRSDLNLESDQTESLIFE